MAIESRMHLRASRPATLLLSILLLLLPQLAAWAQDRAGSLPERITDAQFWSLVATMSEPGGSFSSDNFTSNELSIGPVAASLISGGHSGGAYIGVGPEQNFTYIATIKPKIAFIVDIRRQAVMQHLMYKAIFEMSATRSEFLSRLFSLAPANPVASDTMARDIWQLYVGALPDTARYAANLAEIRRHLTMQHGFELNDADLNSLQFVYNSFFTIGPDISYRGGTAGRAPAAATFRTLTAVTDADGIERSFLASDASYQYVRDMHLRNLIIPVVGDFGGLTALRAVGSYLRDHGAEVTAYYTSNVEQYLFQSDSWRAFYQNVSLLPLNPSSVFIRPSLGGGAVSVISSRTPVSAPPYYAAPSSATTATVVQQPNLGSLAGIVMDSAASVPVSGASIVVVGTKLVGLTAADGKFSIPNVDPGSYTLMLRRDGYPMVTKSGVVVEAGRGSSADFATVMLPGASISTTTFSGLTVRIVGTAGASQMVARSTSPLTPLCPIVEYLNAWRDGRILRYTDAQRCGG